MSILTVGRLVVKVAGRDAGRTGVIVSIPNERQVLIDGGTRRKNVSVKHVEPLATIIDIKESASHEEVKRAFEQRGLPVWETKPKAKAVRPGKKTSEKMVPSGTTGSEEPAKETIKRKKAVKE